MACPPPRPPPQIIRRGFDHLQLTPGTAWSSLLLNPDTTSWLVSLLSSLQQQQQQHGSSNTSQAAVAGPLASKARQVLVSFCSLTGDVFPKQDPGGMRRGFLRHLLQALLPGLWPAEHVLQRAMQAGEGQFVDMCR